MPPILALGLVHGLLYLALMPPWQHYDEPTHFEYVRLIAARLRLPQPGDYDLEMRREIASSMWAWGFWKGTDPPAIDFWSPTPPGIGVSELGHPPLYYLVLALPQWFVNHQSVDTQLYLARACSLLLFLLVLASAYRLVAEAVPQRLWLAPLVAGFIALLPPFADLMSSVNNDVGAIAAASGFLWACVRLVRRGPTVRRAAAVTILAGVCAFTKNTAGIVAISVLALLGLSYMPRVVARLVLAAAAALAAVAVILSLQAPAFAAHWYSRGPAGAPNRIRADGLSGGWTLALSSQGQHPRTVLQELGRAQGRSLSGHVVTVGGWFRSDESSRGFFTLVVDDGMTETTRRFEATSQWQFYAFSARVGDKARGVAVYVTLPEQPGTARALYADGMALVDGTVPASAPARFSAEDPGLVDWGGTARPNLLRNGSAEKGWPGLPGWLRDRILPRRPIIQVLHSALDWRRTAWVYPGVAAILFRSFWGGFGWNHLRLPAAWFYVLAGLTCLAGVGAGVGLARRRWLWPAAEPDDRRVLLILSGALIVAWFAAAMRVHPLLITDRVFWPVARYGFVAIVPTALLLCAGWAELVPRRFARAAACAGLLGMLLLDAFAIGAVIVPYYWAA